MFGVESVPPSNEWAERLYRIMKRASRKRGEDKAIYIHVPTATRIRLGQNAGDEYTYYAVVVDETTAKHVPHTVFTDELIEETIPLREVLLTEALNPSAKSATLQTEGGRLISMDMINPYTRMSEIQRESIAPNAKRSRIDENGEAMEVYNFNDNDDDFEISYADVRMFTPDLIYVWLKYHGWNLRLMGRLSRVSSQFNDVILNGPQNMWRHALFFHYGGAAVVCDHPYVRNLLDVMTSNPEKRGRRYDKRTLEWLQRITRPEKNYTQTILDTLNYVTAVRDTRFLSKVWQCSNHVYALFSAASPFDSYCGYLVHWDINNEIPFDARYKPNLLGKKEQMIYAQHDMDGFLAILHNEKTDKTHYIYVPAGNPNAPVTITKYATRKHQTSIFENFAGTKKLKGLDGAYDYEKTTDDNYNKYPTSFMTPTLLYIGKAIVVDRQTWRRRYMPAVVRAVLGYDMFLFEYDHGEFYKSKGDVLGVKIPRDQAKALIRRTRNPFSEYVCHKLQADGPVNLISYRYHYSEQGNHIFRVVFYDLDLVSSNLACALCKTQGAPVKDAKLGHPFCDEICQKKWYNK